MIVRRDRLARPPRKKLAFLTIAETVWHQFDDRLAAVGSRSASACRRLNIRRIIEFCLINSLTTQRSSKSHPNQSDLADPTRLIFECFFSKFRGAAMRRTGASPRRSQPVIESNDSFISCFRMWLMNCPFSWFVKELILYWIESLIPSFIHAFINE
jgi:hypothetical protein